MAVLSSVCTITKAKRVMNLPSAAVMPYLYSDEAMNMKENGGGDSLMIFKDMYLETCSE